MLQKRCAVFCFKNAIIEEFFDLSICLTGEIVEKYVDYSMISAIIGDFLAIAVKRTRFQVRVKLFYDFMRKIGSQLICCDPMVI